MPKGRRISRERHKSVPYLNSKIAIGHQSLKNSKYQTHEKPKRRNWRAKRGMLSHFLISIVAKHQKIERKKNLMKKFPKVSHCRKKLRGGSLWNFSTSLLSQNIKKLKGTLWWKTIQKTSHNAGKLKGGTL